MRSFRFRDFALFFIVLFFYVPRIQAEYSKVNHKSNRAFGQIFADGLTLRHKGAFPQAFNTFKQALEVATKNADQVGQLACLKNLGILSWNMGQQKDSAEFYVTALFIAQKIGLSKESDECANALKIYETYSKGKELRSAGNLKKSNQQFEATIELAKKIKSQEHELKCLRQLCLNYLQAEAFDEFFLLSKKGLEIAKQLSHQQEQGKFLNNIGIFHWKSCDYSRALAYYEEALEIARKEDGNGEDESTCLNNIGIVYRDFGDYEKALRYLEDALEIDRDLKNDLNISIDLNNIGEIYRNRAEASINHQDYEEALKYYLQSLEFIKKLANKKQIVVVANNIGLAHARLRNFGLSLENFQRALKHAHEIEEVEELCHINNNMGNVYLSLENSLDAKRFFNNAIKFAAKTKRDDVLWETYFGLGQCFEHEGQFQSALTYYKMAVDIIDAVRSRLFFDDHKAGFVRNKLKVYERAINLLYKLKAKEATGAYDLEIFDYVERAKARAFLEGLMKTTNSSRITLDSGYHREQEEVSKKITLIISELSRPNLSEPKRQLLLERLEKEEEEFASLLNRMESEKSSWPGVPAFDKISIQKIQGLLGQKSAIFEFFLGDRQSFVFFITENKFILKPLPSRATIEDSMRAYLKMIAAPPNSKFLGARASHRIYRDYLFPFEKHLSPSIDHLIIIPDGIFYYLPFESLVQDLEERGLRHKYLIESYKISYAPSVSSLFFLLGRKYEYQDFKYLLALGNPVYSFQVSSRKEANKTAMREFYVSKGFDFSPIPYSRKEVQQIAQFFPKDKADVFLSKEATEEVIKNQSLKRYGILHFACHGFLDESVPFRSSLVFTLDEDVTEDGFLQVREIQNLRVNADLVVLSACQTGRGKLENGEGILGLPRIFFYVGAKATVSTLWKINDHSTSALMRNFYRALVEGKDKAEALRLAKIEMIKSKFSHPFFWAGFVLNGDYRPIPSFK